MHMSVSRRTSVFLIVIGVAIVAALSLLTLPQQAAVQSFTVAQIKSYPFPNELTASATGSRIAWAFNERGLRNVWVAEGPEFKARRLTNYTVDLQDGQKLPSYSAAMKELSAFFASLLPMPSPHSAKKSKSRSRSTSKPKAKAKAKRRK